VTARTIRPGPVSGRVSAPPSKSYTHRGLVTGFLSRRRYSVESPLDSDDTRATAQALRRLGTPVHCARGRWTVGPPRGAAGRGPVDIDCGESGTTLRFVTSLAALGHRRVRFVGRGRLGARPMRPLLAALSELGARVAAAPAGFPFTVEGPLHGGNVRIHASESSQFASSLFFALPTVPEDSAVRLDGTVVSEPYLEATLAVLSFARVRIRRRGREFQIPGGQHVAGTRFSVPGDASSAAYLWSAGALAPGSSVAVRGVDGAWPQADRAALALLRTAGAVVAERRDGATVRQGRLRPFTFDLTPCPDLYPLAGVLAAAARGTSHLRGAPHVVHKESNRRTETANLARAFGARVRSGRDGLAIEGNGTLRPVDLPVLADHRLVMSAAVGALGATGPSRVGAAEAVRKSFPGFWSALESLGAEAAVP
jgi:3-phosphoshikimate 1-carboxyvinyltransferase